MAEEYIKITIVPNEVGVKYTAPTPEAGLSDELAAVEIGLHALARHAAALRRRMQLRVPDALTGVINANTWAKLR